MGGISHFSSINTSGLLGALIVHIIEIPIRLKMKSGCYTVTYVTWRAFCHCLEQTVVIGLMLTSNVYLGRSSLKHILAIQHTTPFGFHLSFRTALSLKPLFDQQEPCVEMLLYCGLKWTLKGPYINPNMAMWTYPGHTCTWKWWHHPRLRQF